MSKIPPQNPWVYYYHPASDETRTLKVNDQDFQTKEARLKKEGWSRNRFAQILYHPLEAERTARTPLEASDLIAQGWSTKPIQHPMEDYSHRKIWLSMQEEQPQAAAYEAPEEHGDAGVNQEPRRRGRPPLKRD